MLIRRKQPSYLNGICHITYILLCTMGYDSYTYRVCSDDYNDDDATGQEIGGRREEGGLPHALGCTYYIIFFPIAS